MADMDFYLSEPVEFDRAVFRMNHHVETDRVYKVIPSISDRGSLLVTIQENRGAGVDPTDRPNRILHSAISETLRRLEEKGQKVTSMRVELV